MDSKQSIDAVSYTHLDVYKRQLQNGTDLSKDLYKSLEDELKAEYGMISNIKFNYSLTESSNNIISSGAVSYTHLTAS